MPRGRTRQPDELKRLKGNRRKEKLNLGQGAAPELLPDSDDFEFPSFLTGESERDIFRRIVLDFLPRRLARKSDFAAYARYSTMLALWIRAKEQLGDGSTWYVSESKHGKMLRRKPAFQDMLDLGKELARMELQLGLTPLSRQTILRGLGALKGILAGLFPDEMGSADTPKADQGELSISPLSYLPAHASTGTPPGSGET